MYAFIKKKLDHVFIHSENLHTAGKLSLLLVSVTAQAAGDTVGNPI